MYNQRRASFLASAFVLILMASTLGALRLHAITSPSANTIQIVDKTYETDVASLFGEAAVAYVKANKNGASDLLRDNLTLTVTSTTGATTNTITINALETDVNSDLYLASFQFTTGAVVDSCSAGAGYGKILGTCKIKVDPASASGTTVSVAGTGLTSDSVVWKKSDTAGFVTSPLADSTIAGYTQSILITLTDTDLDVTSSIDSEGTKLRAFSTSDVQGEAINLVETAATSGVFQATLGFQESNVPGDTLLYVKGGDAIVLSYEDTTDDAGNRNVIEKPFTFTATSNADMSLVPGPVFGCLGSTPCPAGAKIQVVVVDLDRSTDGDANTFTVTVSSSNPVNSEVVTLTEVGGQSGLFIGNLALSPTDSANVLAVKNGATITATYNDPSRRDGAAETLTRTTKYYETDDSLAPLSLASKNATLVLGAGGNILLTGTANRPSMELKDFDANRNSGLPDTVQVRLKSTSNPTGVVVTLTETDNDDSTFALLAGTPFSFTTGTSTSTSLQVASGDSVVAVYEDANGPFGRPVRIISNAAVWRPLSSGQIFLSASTYFKDCAAGACDPMRQEADVFVIDADRNHPFVRESIDVTVTSTAAGAGSITLTLKETGVDTGLYTARLKFCNVAGPPACSSTASSKILVTADGQTVSASYADPNDGSGNPVSFETTAIWHQGTAAQWARFEDDAGAVHFRQDAAYMGGAAGDSVNVKVATYGDNTKVDMASTRCGGGKSFALGAAVEGRRTVQVTLKNIGCVDAAATELGVNIGDTITIANDDQNCPCTITTFESLVVRQKPVAPNAYAQWVSGNAAPQLSAVKLRSFGFDGPGYVTLVDPERNVNRAGRETIQVPIKSITGAQTITLTAAETGVDTGVFLATLKFGTAAANNADTGTLGVMDVTGNNNFKRETIKTDYAPAGFINGQLFWYPGKNATLNAFQSSSNGLDNTGNSLFGSSVTGRVDLVDDGAGPIVSPGPQPGRVYEEPGLLADSQALFRLAQRPYVKDSEFVYVTQSCATALETPPMAGRAKVCAVDNAQAPEYITDRNRDTRIDCNDIDITGTNVNAPATISCLSVDPAGGFVSYTSNCAGNICNPVTVKYEYRAKPAPAANVFQYKVNNADCPIPVGDPMRDCVIFGATIPSGEKVRIEYLPGTKNVKLVSKDSTGVTLETETKTAAGTTVLAPFATPDKWSGTFAVETTPVANNGILRVRSDAPGTDASRINTITIYHMDPVKPRGDASVDNVDDFRNARTLINWVPTQDGQLTFRDATYATQLTTQVSGPFISVQIVDVDADLNDRRDEITATARNTASGGDSITITLRESSAHSGVFRGIVPINLAAGGEPDIDFSGSTGTLRIEYSDSHRADGTSGQIATSVTWKKSEEAAITLCLTSTDPCGSLAGLGSPMVGRDGALYIRVKDDDSNTRSGEADTIAVKVRTNQSGSEKSFTLGETGANTGIFRYLPGVRFDPFAAASSTRVKAQDGDQVFVTFEDPKDADGRAVSVKNNNAKWDQTFNGNIHFERDTLGSDDFFIGQSSNTTTGLLNHGLVVVPDGDQNEDPSMVESIPATDFTFQSCSDSGCGSVLVADLALSLWETGANTGVFIGKFNFTTDAAVAETSAGAGDAVQKVASEGRIKLTYNDPLDENAQAQAFTDEARWFSEERGVVVFDKAVYTKLSVPVGIQLYDFSPVSGTIPTSRTVKVTSQANTAGITVTVTGTVGGAYAGSLNMVQTTSTTAIKVNDDDSLTVTYSDTAPPPVVTRNDVATVIIGDDVPPVTRLIKTPATPNGENSYYANITPSISFAASDDRGTVGLITKFQLDAAPIEQYVAPVVLGDGDHALIFFSVDASGNEETHNTTTIKVDTIAPLEVVGGINATAIAGGRVSLNWTAATGPTDFQRYNVWRIGANITRVVGPTNRTTTVFQDAPATDASYQYKLQVVDKAGLRGPNSTVTAAVVTDRVAPVLSEAVVSPAEFDIRDPVTSVALSVKATDTNLDKVKAEIRLGATLVKTLNMTLSAGGLYTTTFTNWSVAGIYKVGFLGIDKVGNVGRLNATITINGPDVLAPQLTVTPVSGSQIPRGNAIAVTASDNFGISLVKYQIDGGGEVAPAVPAGYPLDFTFNVQTAGLALGSHTMKITAVDKPDARSGSSTRNVVLNYTFTLVEGTVVVPSTFFVTGVTVKQLKDGTLQVTWNPPTDTGSFQVGGYLVWRAASPFALLAETPAATTTYVDKNTTVGQTYRYAVSWFTTTGIGKVTTIREVIGYPGNDEDVAGSQPVAAKKGGLTGLQWFLLIGLPLIALAILIAIVLVAKVQQRRGGGRRQVLVQPTTKPSAAAPAAEEEASMTPEQRHVLRCPQCQHRFEVYGRKPIVTNCPNCGRKGILR